MGQNQTESRGEGIWIRGNQEDQAGEIFCKKILKINIALSINVAEQFSNRLFSSAFCANIAPWEGGGAGNRGGGQRLVRLREEK